VHRYIAAAVDKVLADPAARTCGLGGSIATDQFARRVARAVVG